MNLLQRRVEALFNNRTVAWRVQALVRAIVATLAVLVLVYGASAFVAYNAERSDRAYFGYQQLVRTLQLQMLESRRHEKDFFLRNDISYLERHKAASEAVKTTLARMSQAAPDPELAVNLPKIAAAAQAYRVGFEGAATAIVAAGLNENSGVHGKMRAAVREAEQSVLDRPELEVSMLRLRRHEKDFIQREEVEYQKRHDAEREVFDALLAKVKMPADVKDKVGGLMAAYGITFDTFVAATLQARNEAAQARDAARQTEPLTDQIGKQVDELLQASTERNALARLVATAVFVAALLVLGAALVFGATTLARTIREPLQHLSSVVDQVAKGDEDARSRMTGHDELNDFGRALDDLLDARIAAQRAVVKENDSLNDAVLRLLQAVAVLARRDLTQKVPVTEDVTGPVADALNLLTSETAKTLQQVSDLSADVTTASMSVKATAAEAMQQAESERVEVEATAASISAAAGAMAQIAELARVCNVAAEQATRNTRAAQETVNTTVSGINDTRETIRETEKRIKRLGERSREISLAVSLIGSVAERTHILALNASMHAASAGEAGRGFAVVADEVQRLAESARQATQQIASLVNNIQTDTADAVTSMNTAIEQVVSGSRLAERAGEQMQTTAQTTDDLVRSVQQIAQSSTQQAQASQALLTRADAIRRSSQQTHAKLQEQTGQTENLVQYAGGLLAAVRVFKLPG